MSNEKKVWISEPCNYEYVKIYSIGVSFTDKFDYPTYHRMDLEIIHDRDNKELQKQSMALNSIGLELDKTVQAFEKLSALPESLWPVSEKNLPKQSDYIFRVEGGGVVVNEACANILQQFRLGESTLTPVKLHKLFTDELWREDTYYFLNLCEHRQYITHPQDEELFRFSESYRETGAYTTVECLEQDALKIDRSALSCDVDLWHDPLFMRSYFMSDALHNALVKAKLHKKWHMFSCQLI